MLLGHDSMTLKEMIGRSGQLGLNLNVTESLDFCDSQSLSITNTMSEHKGVYQCT